MTRGVLRNGTFREKSKLSVTLKFLLGQPGNGGDNFERVRVEKTNLENNMNKLRIGIIGLGTVGSGVYKTLEDMVGEIIFMVTGDDNEK